MSSYSGPLVDWWSMEHPGEPFPDPKQHPEMFEGLNLNMVENVYYGTPSCSNGMLCQYGYFDYKCQVENSCYLNLLQLVGVVVLIVAVIFGIGWLIVLLCRHTSKIKPYLYPIFQPLCCLKSKISKWNCNFIKKYIKSNSIKHKQRDMERLKQKIKRMNIDIDLETISLEKLKEIKTIVDQYEIVDDQL